MLHITKMTPKSAALKDALLAVKQCTVTALVKELTRLGFSERKAEATTVFDCFAKTSNCSVMISLHGVVFKLFIYSAGEEISAANCPESDSIVLYVQSNANAILKCSQFISKEMHASLIAAPEWTEHASGIAHTRKLFIRMPPKIASHSEVFDELFANVDADEQHESPMWIDGNRHIRAAVDDKIMRKNGMFLPDKIITERVVRTHEKHASENGITSHVVVGDFVGEYAYRLATVATKSRIHAFEFHPCAAGVLSAAVENAGLENLMVEKKIDWKARVQGNAPASVYPNLIGVFPFVKKEIYVEGYPAFTGQPPFCGGAYPHPNLPGSVAYPNKELEVTARVGSALMKLAVTNMAAGAVGTFLVPSNFGHVSLDAPIRQVIVSHCEVLEFSTCTKDLNILVVKKRDGQIIPYVRDRPDRNPASSGPHIRWVEQEPVFVIDSSVIGMNAGTDGHRVLKNVVSELAGPILPMTMSKLQQSGMIRSNKEPNDRLVYGTNLWADHTCAQIHIATNPTVIINSKHTKGDLSPIPYSGPQQVGMGTCNYAITTQYPEPLMTLLKNPAVHTWIDSVTSSDSVSMHVLSSIPLA